jgi:predicted nucleic acid-binding protein
MTKFVHHKGSTWQKRFHPEIKIYEADNHLVELAIAGNAQIIVTRNVNDFRRSQLLFPQLKILNSAILYAEETSAYLALKPEQVI